MTNLRFPPTPHVDVIITELTLLGVTKEIELLVIYTVDPADITDTPPQGEAFEISEAWAVNIYGKDAVNITSLLDDELTAAVIKELKECN